MGPDRCAGPLCTAYTSNMTVMALAVLLAPRERFPQVCESVRKHTADKSKKESSVVTDDIVMTSAWTTATVASNA